MAIGDAGLPRTVDTQLDETRLRRLIEIGPWLIAELDVEVVLDRLLAVALEVTGARYAALGVLDSERRQLERFLTRGLTDDQERAIGARPRGSGILGLLMADPQPLRLADLTAHHQSFGFPAGHPPMHSFLGVPILIGEYAWGNLYLTDKHEAEFDAADQQAAVTLAAWAGIAIQHSRALLAATDRQAALERAVRGLEATQAIAVAVGVETDLSRVLELIAKRGRALAEARTVVIMLTDEDDLVVVVGAGHDTVQPGTRIPIDGSTSGQVMLSQKPERITDTESQLRISAATLGVPQAHAALLVPLVYRGRALGVLVAFDRDLSMVFSEEDERLLVAFAASAATAVATAQTVAADRLRHTLEAAEAERKHWARELHDETLQGLGGLKVLASTARRVDAAQRDSILVQLVDGLEGEIENLHTIISELRPAALDELGLRPAIEALAERYAATQGIEVEMHLDLAGQAEHARRLAPELEVTIYRLIQEALTNIAKHAGADRADISVELSDARTMVRVADNGRGFDTTNPSGGFGLTGMRERIVLAGGQLDISSAPAGTTIDAVLPTRYAA
ncbi:MAG: sensor histidine kinase [Solirubrobacteraceae bacterium]